MRKRFFASAGALGACALAGSLAAGCSDLTAGQPGEDSGPPRLLRVMVQDDGAADDGRLLGADILNVYDDMNGPRKHVKCTVCPVDATGCVENPCVASFLGYPSPACVPAANSNDGICPDPIEYVEANGVPIGSITGDPGTFSGNQIRLVFSKLLDPAIEMVTFNDNGDATYALTKGVVELTDPKGMPVALGMGGATDAGGYYYDPNGGTQTSDLFGIPFGPALVMKPADPLSQDGKYTVVLHTGMIKDRKGQTPVDANGMPLPDPYSISFVVEGIQSLGDAPAGVTAGGVVLAPNDTIQVQLNGGVDETSATAKLTGPDGTTVVPTEVFSDRGGDVAKCDSSLNDRAIDIIPVDTADCGPAGKNYGAPSCAKSAAVDLKKGMYKLDLSIKKDDRLGTSKEFTLSFMFEVKDCDPTAGGKCNPAKMTENDPASDTAASANFALPEPVAFGTGNGHCENPAPADGGTMDDLTMPPAGDMAMQSIDDLAMPPKGDMSMPPKGDMSMPSTDMSMPKGDMATPKGDMSSPVDGGNKG